MTASPVSEVKVKSGATSPSRTKSASVRRAVGVVRVSRVGARSGETFVSPSEQRTRIEEACARDKLELIETFEELDVSGGAPLAKRPGLRRAVEMIEAGEADTLVAAYFDRLVRRLKVQLAVAERVEAAGGKILALDVGEVGAGATGKLTAQFLGAVAEYHRNVTAERTAEAKRRAIARGVPTFSKIPPGYRRSVDGTLEPHPKEARTIAAAFRMRAEGATVMETRAFLREHGIERSFHGTQAILTSRIYLGELHFGELVNIGSHPALVDAETWGKVQRMRSPRGRRPKSDRLLARLGILRCGTCGARMVVGTAHKGDYHFYRCPPIGDCPQRVTISAEVAERKVWEAAVELLRNVEGSASAGDRIEAARASYEAAQENLDNAIGMLDGFEELAATRQKLEQLRDARDAALRNLEQAEAASGPVLRLRADDQRLTLEERRALIRAVVDEATVAPGRGPDRLTVRLRG